MHTPAAYEPPALAEVGDFADLTRGFPSGFVLDWAPQPFQWFSD
ncbi:lasso RiPP family leader peptide-containing protein [Nonomuraea sp. NPDC050680]